jgi:hypothetical protein
MTLKFARFSGAAVLLAGLAGFFLPDLVGQAEFDTGHNVLHLVLGITGLLAGKYSRLYAAIVGPFYLALGVLGFFLPDLRVMHLEIDENIGHMAVGLLALWALARDRSRSGDLSRSA